MGHIRPYAASLDCNDLTIMYYANIGIRMFFLYLDNLFFPLLVLSSFLFFSNLISPGRFLTPTRT
jgi:hypothetical protein